MKKLFTMIQSVVHLIWQKNALMPQSMKKLSFAFQICIESEGKIAVKLL